MFKIDLLAQFRSSHSSLTTLEIVAKSRKSQWCQHRQKQWRCLKGEFPSYFVQCEGFDCLNIYFLGRLNVEKLTITIPVKPRKMRDQANIVNQRGCFLNPVFCLIRPLTFPSSSFPPFSLPTSAFPILSRFSQDSTSNGCSFRSLW